MINQLNISCKHVHTFNMDEYADENGNTAPADHPGGFQYWMWRDLFNRIKPELAIPARADPLSQHGEHRPLHAR